MASNKPQAIKTAVVAKTLAGESKTQIANDLDITRNTVNRILEESELNDYVLRGKSRIHEMIPKSILAVDNALSGANPNANVGMWLLERTGVVSDDRSKLPPVVMPVQIITNVQLPNA
jgi:hypothetical protein